MSVGGANIRDMYARTLATSNPASSRRFTISFR